MMNIFKTCSIWSILFAPLLCHASTLNVKAGAWEVTTSSTVKGINIPAETLAKIPPEMRAKIEAGMKANQKPHVTKSCITQADLDQNKMLSSNEFGSCTRKVISSSPTKMTLESTCPAPHASTALITVEALNPESMTGSIDITAASAKTHIDIKGHWLTPSCAGIKGRPNWKAKMESYHQQLPQSSE
ncbi:DUF3617 domain-containing protein [Aquirhabdus sp.]|uniref:DUF3617 domain-containing protein n=1 Tax=Aquirhabdus sp. TaxID=2824160 RepID=UPI00396C97EC